MAVMGAGFIALGAFAVYWGRREEKHYYDALVSRHDLHEYVAHSPKRPEFGALQIGGAISVALGMVLLIIATVVWL